MEYFITELKHIFLPFQEILSDDKVVEELYNEATKTDKKPNLRLYLNQLEPEYNNNENSCGLYSKEFELKIQKKTIEFYNNLSEIESKYHYYDVRNLHSVKMLFKIKELLTALENDNTMDNEPYFCGICEHLNELSPHTLEAVRNSIKDYEASITVAKMFGLDVDLRIKKRLSLNDYLNKKVIEENITKKNAVSNNPPSLNFKANDEFINKLLELVIKLDMFENPDKNMLRYAFFNKPINTDFIPIKIGNRRKELLVYLIYKLAGKIDLKGDVINHELGDIRRKAFVLFRMKNKEGRMQNMKRYPNDAEKIDDFFKKFPSVIHPDCANS